jgi:hypothetical protein
MRFVFAALGLVCLAGGALRADQSTVPVQYQEYRVGTIPWGESGSGDCAAMAADLGRRFESATGLHVVSTSCPESDRDGYTASISYLSDFPVEDGQAVNVASLTYSYYGGGEPAEGVFAPERDTSGDLLGMYATFADCAGALADQVSLYRQATGIEPVAVYCTATVSTGFALHIDGFGTPLVRPRHLAATVAGVADGALVAQIVALLQGKGVTVAATGYSDSEISIIFYSNDPNYLEVVSATSRVEMDDAAKLPELGQCQEQLAAGRAAFGKLDSAPVSAACLSNGIDTAFFPNFVFRHPIQGGIPARAWDYGRGPTYATYADCMANRDTVASEFAAATGQPVGGVLCTADDRTTLVSTRP